MEKTWDSGETPQGWPAYHFFHQEHINLSNVFHHKNIWTVKPHLIFLFRPNKQYLPLPTCFIILPFIAYKSCDRQKCFDFYHIRNQRRNRAGFSDVLQSRWGQISDSVSSKEAPQGSECFWYSTSLLSSILRSSMVLNLICQQPVW